MTAVGLVPYSSALLCLWSPHYKSIRTRIRGPQMRSSGIDVILGGDRLYQKTSWTHTSNAASAKLDEMMVTFGGQNVCLFVR
jgi:hypothetical protein